MTRTEQHRRKVARATGEDAGLATLPCITFDTVRPDDWIRFARVNADKTEAEMK